ncbi:MAG: UDP-N-acetylglucosamine 2-epimerase (non-hydrolyzing) [Myxococcota bacterium]|nr:UDP-N-acetylglucosamine 2-epimerase (non-hydrolyzing) [Myxococcota bacterium]
MNGRPIRILSVAGARPNFMKVAPLLAEFLRRGSERFGSILVHTGQHYDARMSDSFFSDLGSPEPDFNLAVGSGSHGKQTAEILERMEAVLQQERPDAVVVVGDVNSTIAATLAAVKLGIPVAHVEAGLRSFDREMPEEINRILTDSISRWLFTTEEAAEENLHREGISPDRIHFVGNVMIDTLLANLDRARSLDTLERLALEPGTYGVLTLHRPSNVDDAGHLRQLIEILEEIHDELPILFPVHPRTQSSIEEGLGGRPPRLRTTEPLGYLEFLQLMANARLVLTDSGGIQEETTALGIDCLTLRDSTERPITISQGTNYLVGTQPDSIRKHFRQAMDQAPRNIPAPSGWDGRAAERIADILERDLGKTS